MLAGFIVPQTAFADKSYNQPSLCTTPRHPHLRAREGIIHRYAPWVLTIAPKTFDYDIYFREGCRKKTFPIRIGRYWQISDVCEFWPKSHYNGAAAEINKYWKIAFEYTDEDLYILPGLTFPEESIKIVFSDDGGNNWTMLRTSTVDPLENTVAAITNKPGGYMAMAGFVNPKTYYNYSNPDVLGATTSKVIREAEKLTFKEKVQTKVESFLLRISYFINK